MSNEQLYYIINRQLQDSGRPCRFTGSLTPNNEPIFTTVIREAKKYTRTDAETEVDTVLDNNQPFTNGTATYYDLVPVAKEA